MDAATHQRGKCLATARLHTTVFDPASHSSQPDFCRIFPLLLPALPAATLGCIHMGSFIQASPIPTWTDMSPYSSASPCSCQGTRTKDIADRSHSWVMVPLKTRPL